MRRIAALTLTLTLALTVGAQAADTGPDNVVNVETQGANATSVKSKLKQGSYGGDNLQSENVASAYSHDCTDCRTIAVAVQAVFVTGNPATAEPKNVAASVNERCVRCSTFAYAYQYVVSTDGPVHLNAETRDDIHRIRHQISDVAHSDLAPPDMDARLQQLTDEYKSEIDQGLAASGDEHGPGHVREHEEAR